MPACVSPRAESFRTVVWVLVKMSVLRTVRKAFHSRILGLCRLHQGIPRTAPFSKTCQRQAHQTSEQRVAAKRQDPQDVACQPRQPLAAGFQKVLRARNVPRERKWPIPLCSCSTKRKESSWYSGQIRMKSSQTSSRNSAASTSSIEPQIRALNPKP